MGNILALAFKILNCCTYNCVFQNAYKTKLYRCIFIIWDMLFQPLIQIYVLIAHHFVMKQWLHLYCHDVITNS